MEYRQIGGSGLQVSSLCLGAMTFGEPGASSFMHNVGSSEKVAHDILNRAVDSGINFIDTADVYGEDGLSERVIGQWFVREGRREDVVLATKFRFRMRDGANGTGASRLRIMRTVEASLRRMKTDRIDLYQIHMQDNSTPEEETLRALDDLVSQGKVLYIGCSNYAAYRLVGSLYKADKRGYSPFISLQAQYSLVDRALEREHVPLCKEHGLGILPWSPLGGGFLTGKYKRDQAPPEGTRMAQWKERYASFNNERNWRILDAVTQVAGEVDASPAQVSLAWLLTRPQVCSIIFGARTVAQLDDNLRGAEITLSDDQLARLTTASAFDMGSLYAFLGQVNAGRW